MQRRWLKKGLVFEPLSFTRDKKPGLIVLTQVNKWGYANLGGVWYGKRRQDAKFIVACELAERMFALSKILKRHGVTNAQVISSYRAKPVVSYHSLGLGLDISKFKFEDGKTINFERGFELTPEIETCPVQSAGAKRLHRLFCDIAASRLFSTVLSPNYNEGHRDHLHLDIRPDEARMFVR